MIHDATLLCATSECMRIIDGTTKLHEIEGLSLPCSFVAPSIIHIHLEVAFNKVVMCVMDPGVAVRCIFDCCCLHIENDDDAYTTNEYPFYSHNMISFRGWVTYNLGTGHV